MTEEPHVQRDRPTELFGGVFGMAAATVFVTSRTQLGRLPPLVSHSTTQSAPAPAAALTALIA